MLAAGDVAVVSFKIFYSLKITFFFKKKNLLTFFLFLSMQLTFKYSFFDSCDWHFEPCSKAETVLYPKIHKHCFYRLNLILLLS